LVLHEASKEAKKFTGLSMSRRRFVTTLLVSLKKQQLVGEKFSLEGEKD
jgi:hypothetical protein